jgi:hypothetical protein
VAARSTLSAARAAPAASSDGNASPADSTAATDSGWIAELTGKLVLTTSRGTAKIWRSRSRLLLAPMKAARITPSRSPPIAARRSALKRKSISVLSTASRRVAATSQPRSALGSPAGDAGGTSGGEPRRSAARVAAPVTRTTTMRAAARSGSRPRPKRAMNAEAPKPAITPPAVTAAPARGMSRRASRPEAVRATRFQAASVATDEKAVRPRATAKTSRLRPPRAPAIDGEASASPPSAARTPRSRRPSRSRAAA